MGYRLVTWNTVAVFGVVGMVGCANDRRPSADSSALRAAEADTGSWLSGDLHTHTFLTDGSHTQTEVVQQAFGQFGLDWLANSEHGGQSTRDETGHQLSQPEWRWRTLRDRSFPLIQTLRTAPVAAGRLLVQGLEWNCPGHEHVSVGIADDEPRAISDFEYVFDAKDKDSSRSEEGLSKYNTTPADALAALEWLAETYPNTSYAILNHPSRKQTFSAADLRAFNDAAPDTCFGLEGLPGHQNRFSGGVVNMVTKSGGNEFSGSFRTSLANESWNGETPLTTSQEDKTNPTYEATFGGYLWRDRLWFFLAGRTFTIDTSDNIVTPGQDGIPFAQSQSEDRYEGKLTASFGPSHRVMGSYFDRKFDDINSYFFTPADDKAIDPSRQLPITGLSATYNGVLTDNFFVEALYSKKEYTFANAGGEDQRLGATPVWDLLTSYGFNEHIFCGSCTDEQRNNENIYGKGSWFFSAAGTHDFVFGVDVFDDKMLSDNWQSATGYIWGPFVEQNYDTPGDPLTVIEPFGGYIIWGSVLENSRGSSFKTESLYVNDTWRVSDKLTVGLGLRYDKNNGTDGGGVKSVDDARVSPRLSASYDLFGDGKLVLNAGASRYVMSINQNAGDAGSTAGQPTWAGFLYVGPEIIAGTPEYPTNFDAITAMMDWFLNVYGGPTNTEWAFWYDIPGLSPKVDGSLASPYGDEYTVGASWRLGNRGVLRADYVYREYGDFYMSTIVPDRQVEVPNPAA